MRIWLCALIALTACGGGNRQIVQPPAAQNPPAAQPTAGAAPHSETASSLPSKESAALVCDMGSVSVSKLGGMTALPEVERWEPSDPLPGSDKEHPIMRCGPRDSYYFVASLYRCPVGSNPLDGDVAAARNSRRGNVGANSKGHIIDVYEVPCSPRPQSVYVDLYGCPESENSLPSRALQKESLQPGRGAPLPPEAARLSEEAFILRRQSQPRAALPRLERAVQIAEAALGPDSAEVAAMIANLGLLHIMMEEPAQAVVTWHRAYSIWEKLKWPRDLAAANTAWALSVYYLKRDDYDRAECLLQRALTIYEMVQGPYSEQVITVLSDLARVYEGKGVPERAEGLLKRALFLTAASQGGTHPDLAPMLNQLAKLYDRMGATDRAAATRSRARQIAPASENRPNGGV